MELLDALRQRRSVKHYQTDHEFSDAELRRFFEQVALTPTSFNMQNWHFVAVRDAATKGKLCEAAWNQAQIRDASLVVVCCGNLEGYRNTERYLRNAPEQVREMFQKMIPDLYAGKQELLMQEACRTIGLAGMSMMLLAKDMGYDSCPMIGFDPAKVAEIVQLPDDHPPLLLLTIGKAAKPARPRMGFLNLEEFISLDRFGNAGLKGEVPAD